MLTVADTKHIMLANQISPFKVSTEILRQANKRVRNQPDLSTQYSQLDDAFIVFLFTLFCAQLKPSD